jgi:hypothetical protein
MKSTALKLFLSISLIAVLVGLSSCSSQSGVKKNITSDFKPGSPGGSYLETYQTTATLTAINPSSREMSFTAPDGSTNTFIAGPKFLSFDSYHIGDEVKVTVARQLVAWFAPETPPASTDVAAVVRNQPGVKPGVLRAPTTEVAATVLSVDPDKQEATVSLSNGRTAVFKVRPDIDLTKVKIGTTGIIRASSAMAVMMEKP